MIASETPLVTKAVGILPGRKLPVDQLNQIPAPRKALLNDVTEERIKSGTRMGPGYQGVSLEASRASHSR